MLPPQGQAAVTGVAVAGILVAVGDVIGVDVAGISVGIIVGVAVEGAGVAVGTTAVDVA